MKYRKRIGTLLNATTESNTRSHAGAGSVNTENSGNEQTDSTRDAQTGIYRRGAQRQACHIQPRKSSAQRVYEQSGDIYLVQELLGHRSVSTTQKYLGVNYATAREFVEAIAIGYERDESPHLSRSKKTTSDETLLLELAKRGYDLESIRKKKTTAEIVKIAI